MGKGTAGVWSDTVAHWCDFYHYCNNPSATYYDYHYWHHYYVGATIWRSLPLISTPPVTTYGHYPKIIHSVLNGSKRYAVLVLAIYFIKRPGYCMP